MSVNLQDIVEFLLEKNIPITLMTSKMMPTGAKTRAEKEFEDVKVWYALPGFYKSEYLYICTDPLGIIQGMCRYGGTVEIDNDSIEDAIKTILYSNLDWLRTTQQRNAIYSISPDPYWLDLLVEYGMIQVKTETRKTYVF